MRRNEQWRDRIVIDGAHGATYTVGTVEQVDAALAGLCRHPGHPDVDRLLDARLLIGASQARVRTMTR